MGETEQDIYWWEKHRDTPIIGSADRLIRVIFAEHENDSNDTRWLLERLAKLDKIYHSENTFETGDDGWKIVVWVDLILIRLLVVFIFLLSCCFETFIGRKPF